MCPECYADKKRATPLRDPLECLMNHTQYICGTCGRCICIECEPNRGSRRWNFPFKSLENAKLYLRTADFCMKKPCGIYEITGGKRISYKIFSDKAALNSYLEKNPGKSCKEMEPVFIADAYKEYPNTQVRKLTVDEVKKYMSEK